MLIDGIAIIKGYARRHPITSGATVVEMLRGKQGQKGYI